MAKLNQIIAIEKGIKSRVHGEITDLYKTVQKPELFGGFSKSYLKKDEDGEDLPSEKKRVQFSAPEVLRSVERSMTELFGITARKDWTNTKAVADIKLNGSLLISGVPVTYLLFLEKQLTDLRTFVANIPVLDDSETWARDENSGLYRTEATQTHRTKKVQKPIVLYHATEQHPAQTQIITEDVIAGFWQSIKQSGALPKPEKQALAERIEKLLQAVKEAREEANSIDEETAPAVGETIFNYLLEG